ncbi:MAG: type 4a pilus biogenesis protein PilO [Bacillota bacterium]
MPALSSRTVLGAVLGAVALAVMVLLVYAQVGAIREARAAIAVEQAAIARLQAELRSKQELQARLPLWEARLAAGLRAVPVNPDEGALLNDIQSAAHRSGARSLQVRFGSRTPGQGYTEMPLTITFEGSYHGLLSFLDELGSGHRAVRVDGISVRPGGAGSSEVGVEIRASAFHLN